MSNERYDDETLKHLQMLEKMILKYFITLCEENNIEYFMHGGSLLGAIRHNDFIPWDDDIDVIMFRDEYEKFVEIFENTSQDKYDLLTIENTPDYFLLISKISLKGTKFDEWWSSQVQYNNEIFIDIFILEYLPENKILQKTYIFKNRIISRLLAISTIKFENYPILTQTIVNSMHTLLKLLKISPEYFKKKYFKILKKHEKTDSEYVTYIPSVAYPQIYLKNDYTPAKKTKFGELEVNIPNKTDELLTRLYGDYMKLPPESNRYNHAPQRIDFGEYDKKELKL